MMFGVIRAGWDVEAGSEAEDVDGHCFYYTSDGSHYPGLMDWEGMNDATDGDRIGMLLDLDQGSMTVWKNGVQLGVMQEGLTGPLCWAVSTACQGATARIESAPAPASPTEEELAAAKEAARVIEHRERREDLGLPLTATDAECEAVEAQDAAADAAAGAAAHDG